ncbi:hypothetical protein K493DRAFT_211498 [Basidiobolus meristosporus CBS 931.73]|uniref:Uncharacterized protein n=1 Tax=Basidiobolus meristosporus CBS 931.73 TaxID=1314790 RepID=A0A1Y1YQ07_9FUNG|nr:hypothetical protein K493DRAFT_243118 [Basidiobolus meristosporus CBS 931.73]ORY00121.1 hypothetical protein K493DRAFT_211498 [Basidiobolus meristosporus CBS 931.73]|eukprot:ORX80015.1 hypothetical protein K493DRAFT_243118 [Basidiobolus meristosporus CBS 931.73]
MYAGLRSLEETEECIHVGCVGDIKDVNGDILDSNFLSPNHQQTLKKFLWESEKLLPVFLDEKEAAGHYEGYCKTDLWPLLHYILWDSVGHGTREAQDWANYVKVNQKFADTVKEIYKPGDIIWIHDYHLILVPRMIRQAIPDAIIGFFLHSPFPSSEIFRSSPKRQEILEGMLGANQIGFQTYSYARHFISSCTRVLGLESTPTGVDYHGGYVTVGTYPIGIDVKSVEANRNSPGVIEKMKAIREMYENKKIIIGRDKMDRVTGVLQKLYAFEKFLERYPQWRNEVVLIQITTPPQRESPKLESKVSEVISRINGTYGSLEFTPVHHFNSHIDREEFYALLRLSDIGLITSVRDGMNTTSQEYVICQKENHGPLILSEFTGTAGSLSGAILVNPWDYAGVADSINEALTMSSEDKQIKHLLLYNHVSSHTAKFWANNFIKELRILSASGDHSAPTPFLNVDLVVKQYQSSKKRLLLFDYDGTLTAIRKTPGAALPSPEMLDGLRKLTSDPHNIVWVISGRDQAALDEWLGGVPNLGLSAEHGCFIKYPDPENKSKWINLTEDLDLSWKNDVLAIFTYYTERTQGSFIEHKLCSLTWHYRMADPEYGSFQAKECQNHLENAVVSKLPVEILVGKKNLEVRPVSINKGEIVKRLVKATTDCDFVFCAGDDKTDEDMFRALRKAELPESASFPVTIGSANKKTQALWHVDSPEDIIKVITTLGASNLGSD